MKKENNSNIFEHCYTVYVHINKINRKRYVGQTGKGVDKRWQSNGKGYKGSVVFYSAIKKYGWDNFEHIILKELCTICEANFWEQYYIQFWNTISHKNGYNVSKRGDNHKLSEESKRKISEKAMGNTRSLGNKHSEETKRKMSLQRRGRKLTEKWKKNISDGSKREKNWKFGKHIPIANTTKQILSETSPKNKKVLCVETGEIFRSTRHAEKMTGILHSGISRCCNGKYKSYKGFKWEWVIENDT